MRTRQAFIAIILNLLFVLTSSAQTLQFSSVSQQTNGVSHGHDFEKAVRAYERAEFNEAIDLFSEIATNERFDRIIRRDALHFLGRSYLALRNKDHAKEALTQMAEFEPPRVQLDPDVEPPQLLRLYYDVHKERDGDYIIKESKHKSTLAIVDFTNQSIDDYQALVPLSTGLSSMLIGQLNGATDLKVVERERIKWLLDELELQQDGRRVDQSTAVKAGQLLGVHMVLLGSYMKLGKTMLLTARLVDVETGEIIVTEQVKGKADQIFELVESLSIGIAKHINVSINNEELGGRFKETRSLDALLSYSEGLDLLETHDYEAAYDKFLEAYKYDSTYERALLKAKSIEPLIVNG